MAHPLADAKQEEIERRASVERWHVLASRMQDLMGHMAWDIYREQLEQLEARVVERLIGGEKDEFERLKGRIEGLREAYHLPALIIDKAKGMTNG